MSKAQPASVFLPPLAYRCERRGSRVFFLQRQIKNGERCPDGWHKTEQDARDEMAMRLKTMSDDLLRQAYDLTIDANRGR